MHKKSILMIAPFAFYPPAGGGEIIIANNFKALSQQYNIDLVIPQPDKDFYVKGLSHIQQFCQVHLIPVDLTPLPKISIFSRLARIITNLFSFSPIPGLDSFYNNDKVRELIRSDFVLIHLEFATWYHPSLRRRKGKLVLVEHNYEFEYWVGMGKSFFKSFKSLNSIPSILSGYCWGLIYILGSFKIRRQEKLAIRDADLVLCLTVRDKKSIQKYARSQGHVVSFKPGIHTDGYANTSKSGSIPSKDYINLAFVASFDMPQNAHGARFFIEDIFPKLKDSPFNFKLNLVGRNPLPDLKELALHDRDILLTGFVNDVRPYIDQADIYVVPLMHGSGVRIKIMEAMAMGKPIVSTSKGVEGLIFMTKGVIITDDSTAFANEIINLAGNSDLRLQLGKSNQRYAVENFDGKVNFSKEVLPLYTKILDTH